MTKICKQCGRELPLESFRKYAPRGRGVYKTEQGHYTICLECEAISRRADYAMKRGDEVAIDKLRNHYQALQDKGYPPATSAAKKLMGVRNEFKPGHRDTSSLDNLLASVSGVVDATIELVDKIENRKFNSADEAYEAHKPHIAALRQSGKLDYVTELIEAWYDEEDQDS